MALPWGKITRKKALSAARARGTLQAISDPMPTRFASLIRERSTIGVELFAELNATLVILAD